MPLTELILTENVPGLGAEADVVKVRRGYARNYLLPRGKAYEVTPGALRQLDALKQKRAEREARELNEAEELSRRIGKTRLVFTLETGETGKAFGSVTAQDIVNRLKNEVGAEIDRHKIVLERPIKDTGEHEVAIRLHHDVTAQLVFQVKSAEEPKPEPTPGAVFARNITRRWRAKRSIFDGPSAFFRSTTSSSGTVPSFVEATVSWLSASWLVRADSSARTRMS